MALSIMQFWKLVDRSNGPDACWPWLGSMHKNGYGQVTWKGRTRAAHIVAWEIANGRKLPKKTVTRHRCDFRPCCNPSHLLNGTHKENMRDMVERDRSSHGEKHYKSVFTSEVLRTILLRYAGGETYDQIASDFNVTRQAIFHICRGKSWQRQTGIRVLCDDCEEGWIEVYPADGVETEPAAGDEVDELVPCPKCNPLALDADTWLELRLKLLNHMQGVLPGAKPRIDGRSANANYVPPSKRGRT